MRVLILFEREDSGVISGYVIGLPVYAQGATMPAAERAISLALAAYMEAHPRAVPDPRLTLKMATVRRVARKGSTIRS